MTDTQREKWRAVWAEVDRRHQESKDSQGALLELYERYALLDEAERKEVNQLLIEALEAGSETQRFDALAIINQFRIVDALEELRRLAVRLQHKDDPAAPFDLAKVNRIISRLVDPS